ncbi:MAG: hypothetical protein E7609_07870 [Ruminococcaceae bacterium]|nr:hypothetical protein [Oscillospiraceae bacterium]
MPTEKNFRHGHRERVRARFLREGLSAFADYEVLELLLFYAIPRRDTKEQAHALDDTLGSLYNTLTASEAALCRVPGIGARTASFLRSLFPFLEYVAKGEPHEDACSDNMTLARRIYPYLEKGGKEFSLVAFLNNCDEIICIHPLGGGKSLTRIKADELMSLSFAYRAASVVLVDYKGTGIPFPSDTVLEGMHQLRAELSTVGIHVRDYLLYTDTQYSSLFFLTGDRQFRMPSPFFIEEGMKKEPPFNNESKERLRSILAFVTSEEKAEALAMRLLKKYGTLSNLLSLPYETLLAENGEEGAEVLYLKILFEVHSRAWLSHIRDERATYKNARQIGNMFSDAIGLNSEERIALAMFDKSMRLINVEICSHGSVNTATFVMRSLVETAHKNKAAFIAVAHNHPGGTITPSTADSAMTTELSRAFRQAKIGFIDHFVVTPMGYACVSRYGMQSYVDMPDSFYENE